MGQQTRSNALVANLFTALPLADSGATQGQQGQPRFERHGPTRRPENPRVEPSCPQAQSSWTPVLRRVRCEEQLGVNLDPTAAKSQASTASPSPHFSLVAGLDGRLMTLARRTQVPRTAHSPGRSPVRVARSRRPRHLPTLQAPLRSPGDVKAVTVRARTHPLPSKFARDSSPTSTSRAMTSCRSVSATLRHWDGTSVPPELPARIPCEFDPLALVDRQPPAT